MGASDSGAGATASANWLKRIILAFGLLVILAICVGLAVSYYLRSLGVEYLKSALAEADELDPGWRLEDLEAKRPIVPDAENAALHVESAHQLLPNDWLRDESTINDEPQTTILDRIRELEPAVQLNDEQVLALRGKLKRLEPALAEARLLAALPTGRYPTTTPEKSRSLPDWQDHLRKVANLLLMDSALLAHDQEPDAALVSGRALLDAGRSIGDEPLMMPHLVRFACQRLAIMSIERTLAQGQASEPALAMTQRLLAEEENQPNLICALRGQRAYGDILIGWMEAGDPRGFDGQFAGGGSLFFPLVAGTWMENRARMLTLMTEAVEIAKLPPDEQADRFQELDRKVKALPRNSSTVFAVMTMPAVMKLADASLRNRAELRCAIAALAVERYRLAHGRWPDSLDQLIPKFLPNVPVYPYDRKPLRLKMFDDGVLINNSGKVFRIWNIDRRRQPPPPDEPLKPGRDEGK